MMPTQQDLRETVERLAHRAPDVPAMPVIRPVQPRRALGATRPALLLACAATLVIAVGVIGVGQHRVGQVAPAAPPVATGLTAGSTVPTAPAASARPSGSVEVTPAAPTASGGPLVLRPLTASEVTDATSRCLSAQQDLDTHPRRGTPRVRYAMLQAAAGYPIDGTPRTVLLLEDDLGYYDCSDDSLGWYGKGGDATSTDDRAGGAELPTISGGSSLHCPPQHADGRLDSAVVLKTAAATELARVTLRAAGGTRTVTVSARTGYVYVPVQVSGSAAWKASTLQVELLDAAGRRLGIQQYAGSVTTRLSYPLAPCTG